MNLDTWLDKLGMRQYAKAFRVNDIDAEVLAELDEQDLEKIGVGSLGRRKKLLKAIAALGEPLEETPATVGSAAEPGEAERRHLTVMFCDLVGSTALSSRYDPEDLASIVRTYQDACAGIVSRYEGYIARYMGDGMPVYFGYPRAHEDDAERALRTGLEIIARVALLEPRPGLTLQTRVGVATGLVVVGEKVGTASVTEQVVLGETPNLAARLQAVAEPDQLVVAESTRALCGDLFEYRDLGAQELKGFEGRVNAFAVTAERSAESRFEARSSHALTPIVGREQGTGRGRAALPDQLPVLTLPC